MDKKEPIRLLGQMKEQVQREHAARRMYQKKWGHFLDNDLTKIYSHDELNRRVCEQLKLQDLCPYIATGEGDSFFVSKDMYNSLVAKCRCDRPRRGCHMLKCLQKVKEKSWDFDCEQKSSKAKDGDDGGGGDGDGDGDGSLKKISLPDTTNGEIGWLPATSSVYRKWEQSTRYISPIYTMIGPRVTATPYNCIFIG